MLVQSPGDANCRQRLSPAFLAGGGETGRLMRTHDWTGSQLGRPDDWPQRLQALVQLMLSSRQPMFVVWGSEHITLYNDGYSEILQGKHPAMGTRFHEIWTEIWGDIDHLVRQTYAGEPVQMDDFALVMVRNGYPEETHFSFSYTPIRDESGTVSGFFCACTETTKQVIANRRARLRAEFTEQLRDVEEPDEIVGAAVTMLGNHLKADCVGYCEVDDSGHFVEVMRDWTSARGVSIVGRHRLDDFGALQIAELNAGHTVTICDVATDALTAGALVAFEDIRTRALVSAPVMRQGRLRGITFALAAEARPWVPEDVELIEEVSERVWAVLDKARANAALRLSEARATRIIEGISDGFLTLDAEWRITFLNRRGAEILQPLIDGDEDVLGKVFWDAFPQVADSEFGRAYRRALEFQKPQNVEAYYPPLDSWFDVRCYPMAGNLAVHFLDVSARVRAQDGLRESEAKFRTITEAMPQMVWSTRPDGYCDFMNQRWYEFTGAPLGSAEGEGWTDLAHRDDQKNIWDRWKSSLATGELYEIEYRLRHNSGSYRWVLGRAAPLRGEAGVVIRWMGTFTDIHDLKTAQHHRGLLLDELNHRVKNTLAVVQAMAHQTFRNLPQAQEARRSFGGRLSALSAAHSLLTETNWGAVNLQDLARETVDACSARRASVELEGPTVMLEPKQALTLAMAFHELSTNAVKYGALSNETGRVHLQWAVCTADGRRRIRVAWREKGGPPVDAPSRRGFGTGMIEQALARELEGEVALDFRPEGLVCRIEGALRPFVETIPR